MPPLKINFSSARPGRLLNRCDALGSMLSSLCAVHCLCMPLVIGLLPMIGFTFLAGHTFERIASGTMIIFAAACVWSGCRVHRKWGLLVLLAAGAALVLYIQLTGASEEKEKADWMEAAVMALGGLLIATSHFLNRKLRARCHCTECDSSRKETADSSAQP